MLESVTGIILVKSSIRSSIYSTMVEITFDVNFETSNNLLLVCSLWIPTSSVSTSQMLKLPTTRDAQNG